jgi:hypothetical protein
LDDDLIGERAGAGERGLDIGDLFAGRAVAGSLDSSETRTTPGLGLVTLASAMVLSAERARYS